MQLVTSVLVNETPLQDCEAEATVVQGEHPDNDSGEETKEGDQEDGHWESV